jgi:hypothetical protein
MGASCRGACFLANVPGATALERDGQKTRYHDYDSKDFIGRGEDDALQLIRESGCCGSFWMVLGAL